MSLAQRSLRSTAWNVAVSVTDMVVIFVRSILLARWLPVEVFGVYAFALSVAQLSIELANFGMGGAFLYRAPEVEDEEQAASVHFTLKLIFTAVWAALSVVGVLTFAKGQMRTALLLVTLTTGGMHLAKTPRMILIRRVMFRRLAVIQFLSALFTTLVALGLAWQGITLWALLSMNLVSLTLEIVALYVWQPIWQPRLKWSPPAIRYFLSFGSRNVLSALLLQALDRVDDLWVGFYLGEMSMGFYSRAYKFATYPRQVLAAPLTAVIAGTYAELKEDYQRLSRAFFNVNAFLVRSGFFLAGLLALVAPEFIRLALGEKWLPMLEAFRLMLVFTLFDPMKQAVSSVLVSAIGKPELVARARLIQLVILIAGLFLLGPLEGIAGVALAVDMMLVVGIAVLLWQVRTYVKFSLSHLLVVPGLALVAGIVVASYASTLPQVAGSDWRTGFVKVMVFSIAYGIILLGLERRYFSEALFFLIRAYRKPGRQASGILPQVGNTLQ